MPGKSDASAPASGDSERQAHGGARTLSQRELVIASLLRCPEANGETERR